MLFNLKPSLIIIMSRSGVISTYLHLSHLADVNVKCNVNVLMLIIIGYQEDLKSKT